MLCVPPESITSASPRRMISVASPIAWLLAAQAVRQLAFGPWALNMPARWPAGMFGSCSSSAIGLQRFQAGLGELGHVELVGRRARRPSSCVKQSKSCWPSPLPR